MHIKICIGVFKNYLYRYRIFRPQKFAVPFTTQFATKKAFVQFVHSPFAYLIDISALQKKIASE